MTITVAIDLVRRLRSHDDLTGGEGSTIWAEAADEVERLQGALHAILDEGDNGDSMAAIARAALKPKES